MWFQVACLLPAVTSLTVLREVWMDLMSAEESSLPGIITKAKYNLLTQQKHIQLLLTYGRYFFFLH